MVKHKVACDFKNAFRNEILQPTLLSPILWKEETGKPFSMINQPLLSGVTCRLSAEDYVVLHVGQLRHPMIARDDRAIPSDPQHHSDSFK